MKLKKWLLPIFCLIIGCSDPAERPSPKSWNSRKYSANTYDVYWLNPDSSPMDTPTALADWIGNHPDLRVISFSFACYDRGIYGISLITTTS